MEVVGKTDLRPPRASQTGNDLGVILASHHAPYRKLVPKVLSGLFKNFSNSPDALKNK